MRLDAAKVFLIALWVACLYRAVTQSIVHDEALTWELYLAGPASAMFTSFDANHHFLNTLLMRASTGVFGLSELSMRLPALCGAALYFAAVYRVARRISPRWPLVLLAVAALTLNPFVLDFMVAARGYGMALALWMWSFAVLLPGSGDGHWKKRDLLEAGIAVSLSVMANLTFVLPAAMLAGCVVVWWHGAKNREQPSRRPRKAVASAPSVWLWFALPIGVCALAFWLAAPLDVARAGDFYAGSDSLAESLRNLVSVSMLYAPWIARLPGAAFLRDAIAFVIEPGIVIAALVLGFRRGDRFVLIPAVTAAGSAALIAAAHLFGGMPWPLDRTGLYFEVLVVLALIAIAARISAPVWSAVAVLALVFAVQFNTRSFYVWRYDADSRAMANQIAERRTSSAPESVQVAGSWQLEPALNFYRVKNGWTWMQPMERRPLAPGAAFYALISSDAGAISTLNLHPVYKGPRSGSVLAVP